MFKACVFAVSTVVILSTSAFAGDENAIIRSQSIYDRSGFYAGLQGGGGLGNVDWSNVASDPFFAFPGDKLSHSPSGAVVGIFAGHNWQMDNFVYGFEAGGLFGEVAQSGVYVPFAMVFANSANINAIVTAGPRFGIIHDDALFYVEGGFATAEVRLNHQTGPNPNDASTDVNTTEFHAGYYLGVGIEVELNANWAFGIEYNHIMLGDKVHPFAVKTASGLIYIGGVSVDILTARLIKSF